MREDGADVLILVRVKPRAHADRIEPEQNGAWPVSVRAAAREGEANEAVEVLVARALRVSKGACRIERGHKSRDKIVRDLDADAARERLREFASS